MKHGRLIEEGTHESLLRASGVYAASHQQQGDA